MPRRTSVWPVAIQTLTPLGIGIIAVSKAHGPVVALRLPRPGRPERDSRQVRSRWFRPSRVAQEAKTAAAVCTSTPAPAQKHLDRDKSRHGFTAQATLGRLPTPREQ